MKLQKGNRADIDGRSLHSFDHLRSTIAFDSTASHPENRMEVLEDVLLNEFDLTFEFFPYICPCNLEVVTDFMECQNVWFKVSIRDLCIQGSVCSVWRLCRYHRNQHQHPPILSAKCFL